jgi:hypothetical protein
MLKGSPSRIFAREQSTCLSEPRAGPAQSASGVVCRPGEVLAKIPAKNRRQQLGSGLLDRRGPKSKKPDLWLKLRHDSLHDSISVKLLNRILVNGVNLPEYSQLTRLHAETPGCSGPICH